MSPDESPADGPDAGNPAAGSAAPGAGGARHRPSKLVLTVVIAPLIVMVAMTNIANALAATLVNENPTLLIALSSQNRYLIPAAVKVPAVTYYLIGFLRLVAPDAGFFLLGWWYGDTAIKWMERRTPTFGQMMRQLESLFFRAKYPLVAIMPNNPVCLIAGAARMNPVSFAVTNAVGTVGRLMLMHLAGHTFESTVNAILEWVGRYRLPLTVASIALVGFMVFSEWRRGTGQIEQLLELEHELDHELEGKVEGGIEGGSAGGQTED